MKSPLSYRERGGGEGGSWFSEAEQRTLATMLARGINCPRTSSMGRLFDAVAALCGFWQEMTFEGQAAMKLEFAAEARGRGILFHPAARVGKRADCRLGTDDPADPGRASAGRAGRPNQCPFP